MRVLEKKRTVEIVLIILLVLSLALNVSYSASSQRTVTLKSGIMSYTSDAYNTFTGWDWFTDRNTQLSIGVSRGGVLANYGPKIHGVDSSSPQPWDGVEYYCDPDTMIVAMTKDRYDITYGYFLDWKYGRYLSEDEKLARVSFSYNHENGFREDAPTQATAGLDPIQLDIKEDHTLIADSNWVQSTIYITNKYSEPVDAIYVYQDAAYLWLPDQNQLGVTPLFIEEISGSAPSYTTDFKTGLNNGTSQYIAGLYHQDRGIYSGLATENNNAILGVTSDYLLFTENDGDPLNLKYLDNENKDFADLIADIKNAADSSDGKYKNRFIAFPINQLAPGEQVTLNFYRLAIKDIDSDTHLSEVMQEVIDNAPTKLN
ncbi:hypothetical protein D3C74_156720 [compost metagenome]